LKRLPDGSWVTTLQEKGSKVDGNGKKYPQFSAYLPVKRMRELGWRGGMEIRLSYATWKDKSGKHSGWIIEPHGRKCVGCGAFNPREADYCMECGVGVAQRASTGKSSAGSSVAAAAVGSG
jgi:hypothetical protein